MNRSIHDMDIKEYSTGPKRDDIESTMQEEIEYRNGQLERSTGNMVIQMVNSSNGLDINEEENEDGPSLSRAFSASGKYQLELQDCVELSTDSFKSVRNSIKSRMRHSAAEGLKVHLDTKIDAYENMKDLRRKLRSGSVSAALLNRKSYQGKVEDILIELMELESRYGVLPTYRKAVDDIVLMMDKELYKSDRELRELVTQLLTSESSLKAQLALLTAFDRAVDDLEANAILVHFTFLDSVDLEFVTRIEERFNHTNYQRSIRDQLLLVYGSLAIKGNEEVEYRVMDHLIGKVIAYQNESSDISGSIILKALGNTGSKLSIVPILSFLNDSNYYEDVDNMLNVIDALVKVTNDAFVLSKLDELVRAYPSVNTVSAVIETLHNGLEYIKSVNVIKDNYLTKIRTHPLLVTLARAALMNNDSVVYTMIDNYFIEIKASQVLFDFINPSISNMFRKKRYTTDWDSSYSDYNYVASRMSRADDVITYKRHKAYLNSKRLGISDAYMKVVSGLFAGTTTHCDRMKVYGRVVAIGKVLYYTRTAADVKFNLELTTTSASLTAYVKIGSNSLLNINERRTLSSSCWRKTKNVVQLKIRLFRFRYRIFVYVAKITLTIELCFQFNLDLNSNICIGRTGTEISGALGAISPTAGLTLKGSVTANLLSIARGGITASAKFNYRLEPAASVQACTANCGISQRLCIGVYDSYPDNTIDINTWYQTRKVGRCGRWIKYPCIKWGRRRTWEAFTHTWRLGRSSRRVVWQQCFGNLHSQCAAGALSSPLFSY